MCIRPDVMATSVSSVFPVVPMVVAIAPVTSVTVFVVLVSTLTAVATLLVATARPRSVGRFACVFCVQAMSMSAARHCSGDRVGRVAMLPVVATRPLERLVVRYVHACFTQSLIPELSVTSTSYITINDNEKKTESHHCKLIITIIIMCCYIIIII